MGEKWITVELIIRYTLGVGVSFSGLLILWLSSLRFSWEKSSGFAQGDIQQREREKELLGPLTEQRTERMPEESWPAEDQPIPCQRQGGRQAASQSWKGANSAPEMASPTKLRAGFQLLTKTSCDSGQLTSARRVAARDQLPRRDTQHT